MAQTEKSSFDCVGDGAKHNMTAGGNKIVNKKEKYNAKSKDLKIIKKALKQGFKHELLSDENFRQKLLQLNSRCRKKHCRKGSVHKPHSCSGEKSTIISATKLKEHENADKSPMSKRSKHSPGISFESDSNQDDTKDCNMSSDNKTLLKLHSKHKKQKFNPQVFTDRQQSGAIIPKRKNVRSDYFASQCSWFRRLLRKQHKKRRRLKKGKQLELQAKVQMMRVQNKTNDDSSKHLQGKKTTRIDYYSDDSDVVEVNNVRFPWIKRPKTVVNVSPEMKQVQVPLQNKQQVLGNETPPAGQNDIDKPKSVKKSTTVQEVSRIQLPKRIYESALGVTVLVEDIFSPANKNENKKRKKKPSEAKQRNINDVSHPDKTDMQNPISNDMDSDNDNAPHGFDDDDDSDFNISIPAVAFSDGDTLHITFNSADTSLMEHSETSDDRPYNTRISKEQPKSDPDNLSKDGKARILEDSEHLSRKAVKEEPVDEENEETVPPKLQSKTATRRSLVDKGEDGLYRCCICDHKFNRNTSVYGHMKKMHPLELEMTKQERNKTDVVGRFKCPYCEKTFLRSNSVYAHKEKCHWEEVLKERQAKHGVIQKIDKHDEKKKEDYYASSNIPRDSDGKYICTICDKRFEGNTSVYAHRKKFHPDAPPLGKCKKRPSGFHIDSAALVDVKLKDGVRSNDIPQDENGNYLCIICGKKFLRVTSVYNHRKQLHPEVQVHRTRRKSDDKKPRKFKCTYCSKAYMTVSGLQAHKSTYHFQELQEERANKSKKKLSENLPKDFKCQYCPNAYTSLSKLRRHKFNYHVRERQAKAAAGNEGSDPFSHKKAGNHAGKKWPTLASVVDVGADGLCQCKFCDKKYLGKLTTVQHMRTVHRAEVECFAKDIERKFKKFKCPHCDWRFSYYGRIYDHIRMKHPDITQARKEKKLKEAEYACKLCNNKPFKRYADVYSHYKRLHGEEDKSAVICDWPGTCTGPQLCPYCGESYKNKLGLKNHIERVHMRKKNHICFQCGVGFYTVLSLRRHEARHAGTKLQYNPQNNRPCSICGRVIKGLNKLKLHEMKHRGEYRFRCEICNRGFMYQGARNDHMLAKHTDPSELHFECDICLLKFRSRGILSKHRKKYHGGFFEQQVTSSQQSEDLMSCFDLPEVKPTDLNLTLKPVLVRGEESKTKSSINIDQLVLNEVDSYMDPELGTQSGVQLDTLTKLNPELPGDGTKVKSSLHDTSHDTIETLIEADFAVTGINGDSSKQVDNDDILLKQSKLDDPVLFSTAERSSNIEDDDHLEAEHSEFGDSEAADMNLEQDLDTGYQLNVAKIDLELNLL